MVILGNQKGGFKKAAWSLGMIFVIVVLCVFLAVASGPVTFVFIMRLLNFIFSKFQM